MFFFSSRRRHTRYWRDWSSDVCSSDLDRRRPRFQAAVAAAAARAAAVVRRVRRVQRADHHVEEGGQGQRSEERRVGKECRSRWWPYHLKKKSKKREEKEKERRSNMNVV